jgi:hypothetical protein
MLHTLPIVSREPLVRWWYPFLNNNHRPWSQHGSIVCGSAVGKDLSKVQTGGYISLRCAK